MLGQWTAIRKGRDPYDLPGKSKFSAVHKAQRGAVSGESATFDDIRVGDLVNYRTPEDNWYGLILKKGHLGNVGRSDFLWASWETSVARALDPKEPYVASNWIRPQDEVFVIKHDMEPTDAIKKELFETFVEFSKPIYRRSTSSYASPSKPVVEHKDGHVRVGKTKFVYWPKDEFVINLPMMVMSGFIGAAISAVILAPVLSFFSKQQLTTYLHGIADSLERAV